jgi:hypothetical protein
MPNESVCESLRTPVKGDFDVIVAGGGPAGIAAALSAARQGARTLLLEANGCLGGIWTAGLLCWILDADKPGIMAELFRRMQEAGGQSSRRNKARSWGYDPEVMKALLEDLCLEAGVTVQLHTRVAAADVGADRAIRAVLTESRSGREAWRGAAFVDCTGDGELACRAGCGFDLGHPETGELQPASMTVLVTGLDYATAEPFVGGGLHQPKVRLAEAIAAAGITPSYSLPVLFHIYDDLFAFIPNHQYGLPCDDAAALTRATMEARRECRAIVGALRASVDPWKAMRIVATTEHLGLREGRRIHGRYTVTLDDMLQGARHEDAVCRVTFGLDVHNTKRDGQMQVNSQATKPYDIPLRALIAKDVTNLFMAGRCISGDFFAHSSYRVCGNAVAMGEAAGRAAAAAEGRALPS